ncbi:Z1 domain-containing protein [Kineococcus endophyticus]|uniref:Z1 domain-containing protein n=1 Tax=Kineococcus endophyticus TaxID=1181883 RepID=A0ABV3PDU9_9ACTN
MPDYSDHEVITFIVQQLAKKHPNPPVPAAAVDAQIDVWRASGMYDLPEEGWADIERHVKTQVIITMEPGETLPGRGYRNWLPERHKDIEWKRWVAYKQLLTQKGFTPNVQNALDASTDEILNCLGDPRDEGSWKRRGLVIGDVQSGKTATYIGAVNKAADAGYKLVILLAGGTEALRKQTQFRVDEGLIGRDSSKNAGGANLSNNPLFGVGTWLNQFVAAQGLTTQATDFRKTSQRAMNIAIDPNTSTPYIFVLKKNKTALENLRDWLKSQQLGGAQIDIPMLLVDDESDYASVNTKDEESPTVINGLIRSILGTVSKSSYLAFTATPFANVFIDHRTTQELLGDDLFPRDYIRTIDAPSNYVGSKAYFGTEESVDTTKLVALKDADNHFPLKHKSGHPVSALPASLLDAIRTFVVAVAVREARGDTSARSMLVNVSRFKKVQTQVHALVESEFQKIKNAVELHSVSLLASERHAEIEALESTFNRHYASVPETWKDILPSLKSAVHATSVRLINSDRVKQAEDIADLESERMIAVGGDVLSRGLTLDGLTVSYFHRSVGASDTLLQMARWFGYRPGYEDLCRVWLPEDVADQFRYVSGIVEELRGQLRAMKKQNLTPEDFGLKVRMHPETLKITSTVKMGGAEAKAWTVDIAGQRIETVLVDSKPETVAKNVVAVTQLVNDVESAYPNESWEDPTSPWQLRRGVDKRHVAKFLENYVPFISDALFADNVLSSYLESSSNSALSSWTVAFASGRTTQTPTPVAGSLAVKLPTRTLKTGKPVYKAGSGDGFTPLKISGKSSRLAGSTDIAGIFGIKSVGGESKNDPRLEPRVYERIATHGPALMIYLIEPANTGARSGQNDKGNELTGIEDAQGVEEVEDDDLVFRNTWSAIKADGSRYLVCVKIAIPSTKPGQTRTEVRYMLNSVALNSWRLSVVEQTEADDVDDLDGGDD